QAAVEAAETAGESAAEAAAEVAAEAAEVGGSVTATGVGIVAAIAILAIVTGVLEGINVFDAAALPGQLASLIAAAPSVDPDLNGMLGSSTGAAGLYGLFIGATLPEPRMMTCLTGMTVGLERTP